MKVYMYVRQKDYQQKYCTALVNCMVCYDMVMAYV